MKKIILPVILFCLLIAGCSQKVDLSAQDSKCVSVGKVSDAKIIQLNKLNADDYSFYHFFSTETNDCLTVKMKNTSDYLMEILHGDVPLRKDLDMGNLYYCSEFGVRNLLIDKFRNLSDVNVAPEVYMDNGKGGAPWDLRTKNIVMTKDQCFSLMLTKLKELKINDTELKTIKINKIEDLATESHPPTKEVQVNTQEIIKNISQNMPSGLDKKVKRGIPKNNQQSANSPSLGQEQTSKPILISESNICDLVPESKVTQITGIDVQSATPLNDTKMIHCFFTNDKGEKFLNISTEYRNMLEIRKWTETTFGNPLESEANIGVGDESFYAFAPRGPSYLYFKINGNIYSVVNPSFKVTLTKENLISIARIFISNIK